MSEGMTTEFVLKWTEQDPKSQIELIINDKQFALVTARITRETILDKITHMLLQAVREDINNQDADRDRTKSWRDS